MPIPQAVDAVQQIELRVQKQLEEERQQQKRQAQQHRLAFDRSVMPGEVMLLRPINEHSEQQKL